MANEFPMWKWVHQSPDNTFTIKRFTEEGKTVVYTDFTLVYVGAKKNVIVDRRNLGVPIQDFTNRYSLMSKFPNEEMPYIIKSIFSNLDVTP